MVQFPPDPDHPINNRQVDELARQYGILAQETTLRLALTWFGFALCAIYLHPAIIVILALIDTGAELANVRLMADLDPVKDQRTYRATLLCVVLMEGCFTLAAGLVWQVDDPYAKAFAVGMIMVTMLHLTTVRSIHLPYGLCGIATVIAVSLAANTLYWAHKDGWTGLAISTACAFGGFAYSMVAMLSNHDLHRRTAEGEAHARAADAAKGRFLAQMSHELRTPLNAIIGLGQVELTASQSAASRARLQTLVASASGLAVVLDDVLDLSAITDGRVTLRPRVVDVRAELAIIIATFEHQAKALHISLVLDCLADVPTHAVLDPQRMRQCLINLLSNALKHVTDGGIKVTARYMAGQLAIDVADSGPGIPERLTEAIFEPFRKANASAPGVGLGLAISRALARQMQGDLVLLKTASGATFRLTLPAQVAPELPPPAITSPARMTGRTVLIVDDIATNRLVAASFLQASGARLIEADGGTAALQIITREAVDLVLLDMNMPDLDGLTTFREIRRLGGAAAHTVVIAMTADVLPAQLARIKAQGLDGCLTKPLSHADLQSLLRLHFSDAAVAGASA